MEMHQVLTGFEPISGTLPKITAISLEKPWPKKVTPRSGTTGRRYATGWGEEAGPSHIVIAFVVADVANVQNDRDVSEVLPPMRRTLGFGTDLACLVKDRSGAVAGVFDDFALLDEDQRWAVIVAVPGDYAARLDHELAESQLTVGDVRFLFAEIDRAEGGVGHADGLEIDWLARIRHALVGRAFASLRV